MKYNVLLLGNGGREHAIAWKLSQSEKLDTLYIAPGNTGTRQYGINVNIDLLDFEAVAKFTEEHDIELVVVGPEKPLVEGIKDFLEKKDIPVFGPGRKAALLEGSKEFAKNFMVKYDIPTADYEVFAASDYDDALKFIQLRDIYPVVLKADGLASGKGVFICYSEEEVKQQLIAIKKDPVLSAAASRLVVEEFLQGEEASVFVLSDGHTFHILHNAQDHKRAGEGDTGPNTGGMGCYSPAPVVSDEVLQEIKEKIINPTITGMQLEEAAYSGVLYVGLIITGNGPKVIEYNCRLGDPECQVILPSLNNDLLDLMLSTTQQTLDEKTIQVDSVYRCCVVLASGGYPGSYQKGLEISGLDSVDPSLLIFHAGVEEKDNRLITSGGRVLNVVGSGATLKEAIDHAYSEIHKISFENLYYRKDIGFKGLQRF
ncbi:MAG: phosphoribosylamine--glycine ligase [Balneolaceae bacterium]|nr:MAG: phosphoribosylamine--glycine ligase [Balneolaceae bacterium]